MTWFDAGVFAIGARVKSKRCQEPIIILVPDTFYPLFTLWAIPQADQNDRIIRQNFHQLAPCRLFSRTRTEQESQDHAARLLYRGMLVSI